MRRGGQWVTWLPRPERDGVGESRLAWLGNGFLFEMGNVSQGGCH